MLRVKVTSRKSLQRLEKEKVPEPELVATPKKPRKK